MKRIFTFLLIITLLSCSDQTNVIEQENCDCFVNTYVVNDVQTVLIESVKITDDCSNDGKITNELYNNNGVLIGFTEYFCVKK